MMDAGRQGRSGEEAVRRFAAAVRSAQLYSATHPLVERSRQALYDCLLRLLADQPTVAIGVIDGEIIAADTPLGKSSEQYGELVRRLQSLGIERIAFEREMTLAALTTLIDTLAHPEVALATGRVDPGDPTAGTDPLAVLRTLPHIAVGSIALDERVQTSAADIATIRRLYTEAVNMAGTLWDTAAAEGRPDPQQARHMVDGLAQAVSQNRTALVALTALKEYDNYTFTHMVNVSILTMAQARALGIEGTLLREIGLAALMHDIGKVRTPREILTKPEALTDAELVIMQMHVLDGAEILRRTPDIPALAPVVAFEHHLRIDGSGYPRGVERPALNLATMLCSIADVYDAMRSQRSYQGAFPTDRILAVLSKNDGKYFDQHLVRRFSQLLGIYPPGTLVRLDTGDLAVVIRVYAADPYRPRVRVLVDAAAQRVARPYDVNLWEANDQEGGPQRVVTPVDAAVTGIDPLTYL